MKRRKRGDEEAWIVGVTSPAGIEAMFEEQASCFAGLAGDPDKEYLAELGARFGVTALGPPLTSSLRAERRITGGDGEARVDVHTE